MENQDPHRSERYRVIREDAAGEKYGKFVPLDEIQSGEQYEIANDIHENHGFKPDRTNHAGKKFMVMRENAQGERRWTYVDNYSDVRPGEPFTEVSG